MTIQDIQQLKEKVSSVAWNENFHQLCQRLGWNPKHAYAQEKFKAFQELAAQLNKFDTSTLAQIIGAQDDTGLEAAIDEAIERAGRTDTEGEAEVLQLARMLREKADKAESLFIAK